MSLESALARVQELRALSGPAPSTTAAATATQDASRAAFQTVLGQAQDRTGAAVMDVAGSSQLGNLPVLGAASPLTATGLPSAAGGNPLAAVGLNPYLTSGVNGVQLPWTGAGDVGRRMVALAQGEIGVREAPSGSNNAPRIAEYRTATAGAADSPGPWCAYFVSWLAKNAGAPIGTGGTGTGYVPTLESWGRSAGRFVEPGAGVQPGDIVIFERNGDGVADHTGIVERIDANGTVHTIEGNTSDMVARRTYSAGSSQIRGYVRPG